jgi:hypothetical protein
MKASAAAKALMLLVARRRACQSERFKLCDQARRGADGAGLRKSGDTYLIPPSGNRRNGGHVPNSEIGGHVPNSAHDATRPALTKAPIVALVKDLRPAQPARCARYLTSAAIGADAGHGLLEAGLPQAGLQATLFCRNPCPAYGWTYQRPPAPRTQQPTR